MMRCTQNKFTIFFIGLSLLRRVGSGQKSSDMLQVGAGQENLGSGLDGSQKSDPCPTLQPITYPLVPNSLAT